MDGNCYDVVGKKAHQPGVGMCDILSKSYPKKNPFFLGENITLKGWFFSR